MPVHVPPPSAAGAERRDKQREPLTVEIGLLAEHQFYTGFTQDIGTGGLFLTTRELRPIGERFRVLFRIPGSEHDFQPLCEVRWHRSPRKTGEPAVRPGMGLRFLDLTPEERRLIDGLIRDHDTLFYPEDDF